MAHPKQNLPRAFRQPRQAPTKPHAASALRRRPSAQIATALLLAAIVGATAGLLLRAGSSQAAADHRIDHEVTQLLAGIPQHQRTLGSPTARVTLQVFLDLKDPILARGS